MVIPRLVVSTLIDFASWYRTLILFGAGTSLSSCNYYRIFVLLLLGYYRILLLKKLLVLLDVSYG